MITTKLTLILVCLLHQVLSQWLPKIVWTFWNKPLDQQNHLLKALHKNHVDKLAEGGWQLRHLNYQNFWDWGYKIPKLKQAFDHPFWKQLATAQKVDLIRMAILSEYGGVYMDMSIILTTGLQWLLNLKDHPQIQNKYGQQPNLFYTYARHSNKQRILDIQTNQKFVLIPAVQVFFMACKPHNQFMKQWLNFAVDMKILNYHKYKYSDKGSIFLDIAKEEKIDVGGFSERYFEMSVAAIILLDRKQKQLDKAWNYDSIKPRPLAVKQLKIWTTNSDKNAYLYFNFDMGFVKPLVSVSTQKFKKEGKGILTPFVKFWHATYVQVLQFLDAKQQTNCRKDLYLLNSSIIYQYVLKDYPIKFYKVPVYDEVSYRRECTAEGEAEKIEEDMQIIHKEIKDIVNPLQKLGKQITALTQKNIAQTQQIMQIQTKNTELQHHLSTLLTQSQQLQSFQSQSTQSLPLPYKLQLQLTTLISQNQKNTKKYQNLQQTFTQLTQKTKQKQKQLQKLHLQYMQEIQNIKNINQYKEKVHFIGVVILALLVLLIFGVAVVLRRLARQGRNRGKEVESQGLRLEEGEGEGR